MRVGTVPTVPTSALIANSRCRFALSTCARTHSTYARARTHTHTHTHVFGVAERWGDLCVLARTLARRLP